MEIVELEHWEEEVSDDEGGNWGLERVDGAQILCRLTRILLSLHRDQGSASVESQKVAA
jgi:hypothetical protein